MCVNDQVYGWECAPDACNSCPAADSGEWDDYGNVTCLPPTAGDDGGAPGNPDSGGDAATGQPDGGEGGPGALDGGTDAASDAPASDGGEEASIDAGLDATPIDGGALADTGASDAADASRD
jgi:hypothetical protein